MKKEIKRISLMTAIFLTVALVSSAVEAGVIRINGTIAGSESGAPFPDPAEGIYVNGSVMSTDTALGPFTLFYSLPVDFAFAVMLARTRVGFGGSPERIFIFATPPIQRRWYDVQSIRHGEHRGHDYHRRHRRGRNLYGRSGLQGHAVNHRRPKL